MRSRVTMTVSNSAMPPSDMFSETWSFLAKLDAYQISALFMLCVIVYWSYQERQLSHIPSVGGPSLPVLSYIGSVRFVRNSKKVLQEGYSAFRGGLFKVAMLDRWLVVVSSPKMIEELRALPESEMSLHEALCQIFEMDYTLGASIRLDPYHAHLLHSQLTKHLDKLFPAVNDEIVAALDEYLVIEDDEWNSVPALDIIRRVVCRATNRVIVGQPLCREEEYLDMQLHFAANVSKARMVINLFPKVLKGLAGNLLTTVPATVGQCLTHVTPILADRKSRMAEYGLDFPDKPNDMLQWFMDAASTNTSRFSDKELAIRVLVLNFASIHTTANSFGHALYHLAVHPEFMQTLRQEVEDLIRKEGWTKAAMSQMRHLDSFFRESTRVTTLNGLSITRIAMKPFKFSDGTHIPKGTFLGCPTTAVHVDEFNYTNADEFQAFRFVGKASQPAQFAATSPTYIPFGHGKSACPGRFFASVELKALMAHVILKYDVSIADGVRPKDRLVGITNYPGDAQILFRKRKET